MDAIRNQSNRNHLGARDRDHIAGWHDWRDRTAGISSRARHEIELISTQAIAHF